MIDGADDGVGASRQGCCDDEHQGEATHVTLSSRAGSASHHTMARFSSPAMCGADPRVVAGVLAIQRRATGAMNRRGTTLQGPPPPRQATKQ